MGAAVPKCGLLVAVGDKSLRYPTDGSCST